MGYRAPLKDMLFVLEELAGIEQLAALPGLADSNLETASAVLAEAARFHAEVVAPLNAEGDRHPPAWRDGEVFASPGFKDAFRRFADGGWLGLAHPPAFGGQGLAKLLATPCFEMLNSASLSFALCPLLCDAAIEALLIAGSDAQRALYLPKLIDGTWTGTMNLTEPQAGSDLAQIRTRAVRGEDGLYLISGTKIFITYGEHDIAENIVHMVLARTPDAPGGVKGISLFLVPKFVVNADGTPGPRNDVRCVSLEHKLGIRASPTAVMQYGDAGGAIGYLVGEENRGLETMFVMMNAARFAVGMQGIAVAEAAYQKAAAYAKERVQSRPVDGSVPHAVAIVRHPDVRRMLATMRALTEGARALAYVTAAHEDCARHAPDAPTRAQHAALHAFLVPVVKGWSTEMSVEVASTAVQVHGGTGFIEETGAAQYYRDARILPIYEGTTAIQANDLVARKTVKDDGVVARRLLADIDATLAELRAAADADPARRAHEAMSVRLSAGRHAFARAIEFVLAHHRADPDAVYAAGVPYLMLTGIVLSGWQMARALLAAQRRRAEDPAFHDAKIATAHCYADHVLPRALALEAAILSARGGEGALALNAEQF